MTAGRKTGGRMRTVFCDSCKVNPIPIKQCRLCLAIDKNNWKNKNKNKVLASRREFYRKNRDLELARKAAWKRANCERVLKKELDRKDSLRYGEFASAHRMLINLKKLVRGTYAKEN